MAYAYPLYNSTAKINNVNLNDSKLKLSGPEELRWDRRKNTKYYCLDLAEKYHNSSKLKHFHLVTFYFRNTEGTVEPIIIRAQLPQQISYSVGGEWGTPVALSGGDLSNVIAAARGASLSTAIDSTMIWTNPKPLSIKLDIPIFDDSASSSNINFQEALEVFGRVVLPDLGDSGLYRTTPGPLYATALTSRQDGKNALGAGVLSNIAEKGLTWTNNNLGAEYKDLDRVTIQIGGMLLLDYVAIKDFTVTYTNTKQQILHKWPESSERKLQLLPQLATLSVTIETVTGLTTTAYTAMLNLDTKATSTKQQKPENKQSTINNMTDAISNGVSAGKVLEGDQSLVGGGVIENHKYIPEQNSSPVPNMSLIK